MKRFLAPFGGNLREVLMRLLARFQCALIAALIFAGLFEFLQTALGQVTMSPVAAYLRGLLFCIPVALSYYAGKNFPHLWMFIFAAVGISLLSWALAGHVGGLIAGLLVCFFRFHARLLPEEERTVSAFDEPHYAVFLLFGAAFCVSAMNAMPVLQKLTLISAVLYLLDLLAFQGIQQVDQYLRLNQTMYSLPTRRILKTAGSAVALLILVAAFLLLPPAFGSAGDFRIKPPEATRTETVESEPLFSEGMMNGENPLLEMIDEQVEPWFHIPPFVSYLFYVLCMGAILLLAIYSVYRVFRSFRSSFTDSRDVVQYLHMKDRDEAEAPPEKRWRRPSVLDRSPNAAVRRIYRKRVLRSSPEAPRRWHSPAELENAAGLSDPALHKIYEKARYSQTACTPEDVKRLKNQK